MGEPVKKKPRGKSASGRPANPISGLSVDIETVDALIERLQALRKLSPMRGETPVYMADGLRVINATLMVDEIYLTDEPS